MPKRGLGRGAFIEEGVGGPLGPGCRAPFAIWRGYDGERGLEAAPFAPFCCCGVARKPLLGTKGVYDGMVEGVEDGFEGDDAAAAGAGVVSVGGGAAAEDVLGFWKSFAISALFILEGA